MSGESKKLFISHAHQGESAALSELQDLLQKAGYHIRDSSIDSATRTEAKGDDQESIKHDVLQRNIDWASTMLVIISPGIHAHPLADWAINYAQQQGKRIVGVYAQDGKESDLPASFHMYGDALVSLRGALLMAAIDGRINTLLKPDSETELPEREIDRFTCGEPEPQ
ncbi:hypothetical protein HJC22_29660 [Corallococcus exiguus]|uniref:TIR domain-containing protein n=1 Tax=Corallococcus exiguus TaxID=83462 RepID=UPI001471A366|nr:hypothetical protein [Corallococcus exiguus]